MHTIRRIYLYAVTFVSLETVLWGIISLARSAFVGIQSAERTALLASALALILVGVPVFLLHGWLAQRDALKDAEGRFSRIRAVFLYAAMLAVLLPVTQNALALLNRLLVNLFNLDPRQAIIGGDQTWSDNLVAIAINALAAAFLYYLLRRDWLASPGGDDYPGVRRLYRYIWLLYGLALVVFGVQQGLQYLLPVWQVISIETKEALANGAALLIVGAPIWAFTHRLIERSLVELPERSSFLRLVTLYFLVFVSVVGVLGSVSDALGSILAYLLRGLWGIDDPLTDFVLRLSETLSMVLPLGFVWIYYGRILKTSIDSGPKLSVEVAKDQLRWSGLHRLYQYVLALFGLTAAFIGLQLALSYLIDASLEVESFRTVAWAEQFSFAFALLVVGLPLWIVAWRSMQKDARQEGEAGDHARRSSVRKSYLYLVLFSGVMGVMYGIGMLLFELLSAWLGAEVQDLLAQSLQFVKLALLFGLLLVYHGWALRVDDRLAGRSLSRRHAQFPVLILSNNDEAGFSSQLVEILKKQAPGLPIAIHPYSQGIPDETLSAARAVVLPSDLVTRPSEAMRLWLQAYTGVRLVLPSFSGDWHWVGLSSLSPSALAHQTAQNLLHLAEEEEIPLPRQSSIKMIFIYLCAGLFILQAILGLITSLVSMISD